MKSSIFHHVNKTIEDYFTHTIFRFPEKGLPPETRLSCRANSSQSKLANAAIRLVTRSGASCAWNTESHQMVLLKALRCLELTAKTYFSIKATTLGTCPVRS